MPKLIENLKPMLIEEGRKLIHLKGCKELNVRELVKLCGIGLGTFYNYFSNKESFIEELFSNDWKRMFELIEQLEAEQETLYYSLHSIFQVLCDFLPGYSYSMQEIIAEEGSRGKRTDYINTFSSIIKKLLEDAEASGEIKSKLDISRLSRFIAFNMMYISVNRYIGYEEFYEDYLKVIIEQKADVVKVYL